MMSQETLDVIRHAEKAGDHVAAIWWLLQEIEEHAREGNISLTAIMRKLWWLTAEVGKNDLPTEVQNFFAQLPEDVFTQH